MIEISRVETSEKNPLSIERERTDDEFRILVKGWVATAEAHFEEPDYDPESDMGIGYDINEFHKAMLVDSEMLRRHNADLNAGIRQTNALTAAGYREVGIDEARILLAKELGAYDQAGFSDDIYVQNLRRIHETGLDGFIERYADMINHSSMMMASKVAGINLEDVSTFEAVLSQFEEFHSRLD